MTSLTQVQRFTRRIKEIRHIWFWHRCVRCATDIRGLLMWKILLTEDPMRPEELGRRTNHYLCKGCTPTFKDAMIYWFAEEKNS